MGSSIDFLGIAAMVIIIILASATVAGIIYGMRLKRRRIAAEHELAERREAIDQSEPAPPAATATTDGADQAVAAKPEPAEAEASATETPIKKPRQAKVAPIADPVEEPVESVPEPEPVEAIPAATAKPAVDETADAKPVAASAEPSVAAAPATPAPAPQRGAGDITQLKGLGPKLSATLAQLGYTRVEQIAALTPDEASALDAQLGAFQGRMARDKWIEQAKLLAAGDRAGYEAQFGKLG